MPPPEHFALAPSDAAELLVVPGESLISPGTIVLNEGRGVIEMMVANTGDRPIQVGSHYPFSDTNPALRFDRAAAAGRHLDIPAGTAMRFEPGDKKTVRLVGTPAPGGSS